MTTIYLLNNYGKPVHEFTVPNGSIRRQNILTYLGKFYIFNSGTLDNHGINFRETDAPIELRVLLAPKSQAVGGQQS